MGCAGGGRRGGGGGGVVIWMGICYSSRVAYSCVGGGGGKNVLYATLRKKERKIIFQYTT